ncbi:MAG: MarR family transcriptional regulator [Streptococcus sp.]
MIVFHKAERLIRASEAHIFKKHQLTPTQFSVLETLYSKGDLRIQDLIDSILATSGNMTVVIRNMVRDGWITRETDPEDRRAYLVSITDAGRKRTEEALPDHIKNIQRLMQVFNSGEQAELTELLKKFKHIA